MPTFMHGHVSYVLNERCQFIDQIISELNRETRSAQNKRFLNFPPGELPVLDTKFKRALGCRGNIYMCAHRASRVGTAGG